MAASSSESASRRLPSAARTRSGSAAAAEATPSCGGVAVRGVGELAREELGGNGAEVEALAAREHGGGNLLRIRGGEDEDHVRGRLLQRLEEGGGGGARGDA